MTREELINKAYEFEGKNNNILLKPYDFPEDMTEESTIDELVQEGGCMYCALKEAISLIHDMTVELEIKNAEEYQQ